MRCRLYFKPTSISEWRHDHKHVRAECNIPSLQITIGTRSFSLETQGALCFRSIEGGVVNFLVHEATATIFGNERTTDSWPCRMEHPRNRMDRSPALRNRSRRSDTDKPFGRLPRRRVSKVFQPLTNALASVQFHPSRHQPLWTGKPLGFF